MSTLILVVKRVLLALLVLAAGLLVLGLAVYRRLPVHALPASEPLARAGDTALGRALAAPLALHAGLSGIYPLQDGRDAFAARAALADAAEQTIDAQYYIWRDDVSGRLLFLALRRAAERGVRVRLLLDDNNTAGLDALLLALDGHPLIEVRVFNPLMHRDARLPTYRTDFPRANRRMHNKSFTVDRRVPVVGGRNVGDEYFGAGEGVMFVDLDVAAAGPGVDEVSADFERYWTSGSTYPLHSVTTAAVGDAQTIAPADGARSREYLRAVAQSSLVGQLRGGTLPMQWSPARMVSDAPIKGLGEATPAQTLLGRLDQVLAGAARELTIASPYFVPGREGTELLVSLARRDVSVAVLTNALAATDVAAVHAGYARYRQTLLRGGVKLYELKPSATVGAHPKGDGTSGSSGASLHAKTFEVDHRQLFVGSFNMDPRSAALNTEMGLLIDSPALARRLPQALAEHGAASTYAVTLEPGGLRWTTLRDGAAVTFDQEPDAPWWRRLGVRVLSWLPIEWLL